MTSSSLEVCPLKVYSVFLSRDAKNQKKNVLSVLKTSEQYAQRKGVSLDDKNESRKNTKNQAMGSDQ